VEVGISASKWIREYFLDHPDVMVSSRERFEEVFMTCYGWKILVPKRKVGTGYNR
jgi:hypothetical protein